MLELELVLAALVLLLGTLEVLVDPECDEPGLDLDTDEEDKLVLDVAEELELGVRVTVVTCVDTGVLVRLEDGLLGLWIPEDTEGVLDALEDLELGLTVTVVVETGFVDAEVDADLELEVVTGFEALDDFAEL